jgi:hypothetical protein
VKVLIFLNIGKKRKKISKIVFKGNETMFASCINIYNFGQIQNTQKSK